MNITTASINVDDLQKSKSNARLKSKLTQNNRMIAQTNTGLSRRPMTAGGQGRKFNRTQLKTTETQSNNMLLSQNYMSVTTVANTGVIRQPSNDARGMAEISRGGSRLSVGNRQSHMY